MYRVGPQATNDADGYVLYVPSGPDGQLVGSDFTSFFLAAATNPQVNGMRLQKVSPQKFIRGQGIAARNCPLSSLGIGEGILQVFRVGPGVFRGLHDNITLGILCMHDLYASKCELWGRGLSGQVACMLCAVNWVIQALHKSFGEGLSVRERSQFFCAEFGLSMLQRLVHAGQVQGNSRSKPWVAHVAAMQPWHSTDNTLCRGSWRE